MFCFFPEEAVTLSCDFAKITHQVAPPKVQQITVDQNKLSVSKVMAIGNFVVRIVNLHLYDLILFEAE